MQPVLSPAARRAATSSALSGDSAGHAGQLLALDLDRPRAVEGLLDQRGNRAGDGVVGEVPRARQLAHRQAVTLGHGAHGLHPAPAVGHPARGAERAVVAARQLVLGPQVVPEQPAVVDNPGDDLHVLRRRSVEHELPRPGLERVEDDHRPVDRVAEALEGLDDVEGEAVGRPGRQPEQPGQPGGADGLHRLPHGRRRVPGAVGVVQQEQVERVDADPLQGRLRGPPHVVAVVLAPAQARVGEAGKAARAVALAVDEVVADRADQAVVLTRQPRHRPPHDPVGLPGAVDVGREHGVDALARAQQPLQALLVDLLPEVQEAPTAPGAEGDMSGIPHPRKR